MKFAFFARAIGVAVCCASAQAASAQAPAGPPATSTPPVGPAPASQAPAPPPSMAAGSVRPRALAGTVMDLEITQLVSSKTANIGDKFTLRLAAPIMVGDQVVLPAGVPGVGEVVDAGHSGMGGHAGKLVLAGRYLDYDGVHLPIRAFHVGASGRNNADVAVAVSAVPYVGLVAPFIQGGSIDIPPGTRAHAKLGVDYPPADPPAQPTTPPAPTSSPPADPKPNSPVAVSADQGNPK